LTAPQRIVSLLPSATEICFALGVGPRVAGVSHECDFPPEAKGRPVLTAPKIDPGASSEQIDRQVRALVGQGLSVYRIDEDRLRDLRPDLILTQDTCEVCAVSLAEVRDATCRLLEKQTEIVSLSPLTLDDVLGDIVRAGEAVGAGRAAATLVARLGDRLQALRRQTAQLSRPRVLVLEWLSPPMVAGHWTPELIRIAGGDPILGHDGSPTGPIAWERILEADPEVLLVIPCGFRIEQSLREMAELVARPGWSSLSAARSGRIFVVDGNAFFNRPGPRLVESAEIAALAIHPDAFQRTFHFGRDVLLPYAGKPSSECAS
jgi:iron complex transport system substrate-binding protein